jgi:hypothetical protein
MQQTLIPWHIPLVSAAAGRKQAKPHGITDASCLICGPRFPRLLKYGACLTLWLIFNNAIERRFGQSLTKASVSACERLLKGRWPPIPPVASYSAERFLILLSGVRKTWQIGPARLCRPAAVIRISINAKLDLSSITALRCGGGAKPCRCCGPEPVRGVLQLHRSRRRIFARGDSRPLTPVLSR